MAVHAVHSVTTVMTDIREREKIPTRVLRPTARRSAAAVPGTVLVDQPSIRSART